METTLIMLAVGILSLLPILLLLKIRNLKPKDFAVLKAIVFTEERLLKEEYPTGFITRLGYFRKKELKKIFGSFYDFLKEETQKNRNSKHFIFCADPEWGIIYGTNGVQNDLQLGKDLYNFFCDFYIEMSYGLSSHVNYYSLGNNYGHTIVGIIRAWANEFPKPILVTSSSYINNMFQSSIQASLRAEGLFCEKQSDTYYLVI